MDEDIPLGDLPQTGSKAESRRTTAMFSISTLSALAAVGCLFKKKEQD